MQPKCLCSQCKITSCEKKKSLKKRIQGKKNRSTGRYIEDKLLKLLQSWNLPAQKTIASGSLKSISNRVQGQEHLFTSDLYTEGIIQGNRVRIESKKRTYNAFKKYYEPLSDCYSYLHIKGFCYIFNQSAFYNLIKGNNYGIGADIDDKQHKSLHNFFNQDNADIVTLISPDPNSNKYLPFMFCITEDLLIKIMKENEVTDYGNC